MLFEKCVSRFALIGLLLLLLNEPLTATGVYDPSFFDRGRAWVAFGNHILVRRDNKIIVGGQDQYGRVKVLLHYEDGSWEPNFAVAPIWSIGALNDLEQLPDGRILLAGNIREGTPTNPEYYFMLTRLNPNGELDPSFGKYGFVSRNQFQGWERIYDTLLLPGGGMLVVVGNGETAQVLSFTENGFSDESFGNEGFLQLDYGGFVEQVLGNKFLVAGNLNNGTAKLQRFNFDGSLDTSFGTNGSVQFEGTINDLYVQPDGKFITAGDLTRRFNGDGSIDPNFRSAHKSYRIAVLPDANGRFVTIGDDLRNPQAGKKLIQLHSDRNVLIGKAHVTTDDLLDITVTPGGKILALAPGNAFRFNAITSFANSQADFDDDEKADIGVYRPSSKTFYFLKNEGGFEYFSTASPVGRIIPENFGGKFQSDLVWSSPSSSLSCFYGFYYGTELGEQPCFQWGFASDAVVGGDYDGDNISDLAVFRQGSWYIRKSVTGEFISFNWGTAGDKPVPADYDHDGRTDVAIYRPSTGMWAVLRSSDSSHLIYQFGTAEDKPVPADYDGDGRADFAVYRPSNGHWYLWQTTRGFSAAQFGTSSDRPVPGDYDGDGRADIAVFRPSEGNWYLSQSSRGFRTVQWGQNGDIPISTAYSAE